MRGLRLAAIVFIIAVSAVAGGLIGTVAADPVDIDPDTDLNGEGLDGDPYVITNASELQAMGGNLSAHYELENDIDASDTENWNGGDGFEPIGECGTISAGHCQGSPFEGEFNGGGHTISNLVIDSGEDQTGLFGGTDGAEITNVHLEAIDVTGGTFYTGGLVGSAVSTAVSDVSVQGSVSGNAATGGLVGRAQQTSITNATAELSVSGSSTVGGAVGQLQSGDVTRTTVSGDLQGSLHTRGGVVGNNGGTVTESVANVDLSGSYNLGGLVGVNGGTVSDSYATGAVSSTSNPSSNPRGAGGLIGLNDGGTVENSYATGAVDGVTTLGGLVGTDDSGTVSNSYWDTQTTGLAVSGGNGERLTTAEMTGDRAKDSMDFDFEELWDVSEGESINGAIVYYPTLQNNPQDPAPSATLYAGGDGIEGDPYEIENWYHLHNVRENLDSEFILNNNLDETTAGYDKLAGETADGGAGFKPIGDSDDEFEGSFDGNNHTISGLYIDRPTEADVGLFGVVVDYSQFTDQASIEHVGLEDVTVTGDDSVGGLVGYSSGTVADSYVTGTVTGDDEVGGIVGQLVGGTVTGSYTTTTVDGTMYVGGLVGFQSGGDVTDSNTAGTVTGDDWVGGVVGYNRGGDVSMSYTNSTVDGYNEIGGLVGTNGAGGNVSDSYATGTVSGADSVGGLIGENGAEYGGETGGNVSESYATGNVDGSSGVGGLVGRNSAGAESITHAYWDDQAATITESGNEVFNQSDGGHALRTVEMTGEYAEDNMFEFGSTWGVADNPEDGNEVSYPFLQNNTQEPAPGLQTRYAGGDGDAEPYELTDWGELDSVRANLNANFTLAQDLNESTAGYDSVASETANGGDGFEPIGDFDDGFEGSFNGNGNVISDLQINRSGEEHVGLFGRTSGAATVENVHLKNATVRGESVVGGLVGRVTDGTIMHVSATVDVEGSGSRVGGLVGGNSGGEISKSHATGDVSGDRNVGGLVGSNSGEVSKSHATGEVEASDGVVGGLAGSNTNNGEISESYTTSDVESSGGRVGGLVGDNRGEILKSYATGDIASSGSSVGGLVGANSGLVNDSYWDIETTGQEDSAGDGKGLTTAQMTGANASADGNMDGFDFENTWYLTVAYPSLSPPFEGEGTEAEPYELKNVLHLQEMRKDLSANYRLVDDIDASETEDWDDGVGFDPVGGFDFDSNIEFTGTFNGDGHTISDLHIDRDDDYVGLFGSTTTAKIELVGLENVEILGNNQVGGLVGSNTDSNVSNTYVTGNITGRFAVGGLFGLNLRSTVTDSHATGTVDGEDDVGGLVGRSGIDTNIINSHATVAVTSTSDVGGLVGYLYGSSKVIDSHATGDVKGTEFVGGLVGKNQNNEVINSYSTGDVDGTDYVGGLVGINDDSDVINSYATGEVDGTNYVGGLIGYNDDGDVTTSYATGEVDGTDTVGGLVGGNSGTVGDAYWDIESTNQSDSAGGTGLTTAQITGLNATESDNMGALDFATNWAATDSYPLLGWSVTDLDLQLADDELTEGDTTAATVTLTTADGRAVGATTTSDYSSSDSSVASVESTGAVSAEGEGSATITSELAAVEDTFVLSVLPDESGGSSSGSGSHSSGSSSSSGGSTTAEEDDDQDQDDNKEPIDNDTDNESADDTETEEPAEADDTETEEPAETDDTETEEPADADDTDDEMPGFGALVGVVSLLGLALLLGRRNS